MSDTDWQDAWQPMIDAVGTDFGEGVEIEAVDAIEAGAIRKLCEPTEMDCPIFYDEDVAREHGYEGIPAPYSGISFAWVSPAIWSPGDETNYPAPERNAMPRPAPQPEGKRPPTPPTKAGFATDVEIEYHRPAYVGDRLTKTGNKLLSCVPKETGVGFGAFMNWESYIHNQDGELIATVRRGTYSYNPKPRN